MEEEYWERQFSDDQRKALADKGHALPDGSFPIENESDLDNAVQAFGRAGDKAAAKAHIKKRAAALGATGKLPDDWKESAVEFDIAGEDFIPLVEKSLRRDGTVPIKVIQPGWGSSGYYSPQLLEKDGPAVFTKGTKMFWDHPTAQEAAQRPERSLRDLAAEFVSDSYYREDGPAGAGLYADAKVFGPYKEAVEELAPHIGVSIRARGSGRDGQADGRQGKIIEKLVSAQSVDFVTSPGAGGQVLNLGEGKRATVLELFESARGGGGIHHKEDDVELQEALGKISTLESSLTEANSKLTEAVTAKEAAEQRAARAEEGLLLREASDMVRKELAGIKTMPEITRTRLQLLLETNPPLKEGKLDNDGMKVRITEAVKAEVEYLANVTGSGRVRGLGGDNGSVDTTKELTEAFKDLGWDEKHAAQAAAGRG